VLKKIKYSKSLTWLSLFVAILFCAVDLQVVEGFAFQAAQIVSSVSAVVIKITTMFNRS